MANSNIVVNELLAFLQQKLDVMDEVSAVQICKSSFSEKDISEAKVLLFSSLNMMEKMVSRRRDGTPRSVQDIITLLKETDPDDVPIFVARDLNKLPPVTFDHVDVTRLLKDIVLLKENLAKVEAKFEASHKTVLELREQMNTLRNSMPVIGSPADTATMKILRGGASDTSFESAVLTPPPPPPSTLELNTYAARIGVHVAGASPRGPAPAPRPPAPAARRPVPAARPPAPAAPAAPAAPVSAPASRQPRRVVASAPQGTGVLKPPCAPDVDCDEEGFITVQKKSRRRAAQNFRGTAVTGPNFLLRPATPTTALYLSRLHYTVTAKDVEEHIRLTKKYLVRVRLLESSHERTFNSFVVLVPTADLDFFMREDYWPKGVVYRRFRGRPRISGAAETKSEKC